MYQYRNLPPRHQPPGFYPPHQPSLRHPQNPHQHPLHPVDDQLYTHMNPLHPNTPLTRSHSHGRIQNLPHGYIPPHHHNNNNHSNQNGYRTHHIIASPPPKHKTNNHNHNHNHGSDALQHYALQQVQRIKAVTACQIIESRVVEAMKQQQMKKLQEKLLKRKLYPNWKDPNETNPNNPAYKGPHNGKFSGQANKKNGDDDGDGDSDGGQAEEDEESMVESDPQINDVNDANEDVELTENDKMMTIPQLEISSAPKSTANITNLTDEELKMNPELYTMYRYYIPFANSNSSNSNSNHLRSQSLPPTPPDHDSNDSNNHHHHRTNMGPRRRNPNFLKPQLINNNTTGMMNISAAQTVSESSSQSGTTGTGILSNINNMRSHSYSPTKPMNPKAKLIPIGKVKPNPLERNSPARKHNYEPHIAPAHANVQSVISPNGGIYHPCHGYSTRDISIFDLFPGIVKYQSKKYAECDRVDYLLTLSEKSFCSVNNRPLKVDESEMWYTALKYLFNDITLGQFDYMSVEMRYVIKQYMSTHKNRLSFLNSIKNYGFLRVISDISKKLPIDRIQKIIQQEKEQKEKEKLLLLCKNHRIKEENRKKLLFQQQQFIIQQQQQHFIQQQQVYHHHIVHPPPQSHTHTHYADWYNGNKLKRTISEPTHYNYNLKPPTIIDDDEEDFEHENVHNEGECDHDYDGHGPLLEEEDDIDDPWKLITQIVNNNKINNIPDLPPEKNGKKAAKNQNMDEIVDVYTMLYQTMKDENQTQNDNGPNISFADLTVIDQSRNNIQLQNDSFIPKLPFKWCKNSSSIWIDNPYAKPSKYFKKCNKYKRGKSQRK